MPKSKSFINKKSEVFLEKYLNNASPTGFESEGQKLWLEYIKPYIDDTIIDTYGTAVGVINPTAKFKVVIEAHADEISWFVHYITNEGFIYLRRNGGSDHQIAPSKRVNIHTKKGVVKAVFGWPGLGQLAFQTLFARDINLLLGIFFLSACLVVVINLLVDLIYTFLDPRIELD